MGPTSGRRGLLRKYVVLFATLVSGALLASGALEIFFSYVENRDALVRLQREKALAAAGQIEQFVTEIERQLGWTTHPQVATGRAALEQRQIDFWRLMRQVPAITELSALDDAGREQLRVSRLAMNVVGSGADFSGDPKFTRPTAGQTYFSPVYFRKESEPYMSVAMRGAGGVTVAEVNLKFIWDVVSRIKIGRAGHAYVVDRHGQLIAHPDISLVLKKSDLSALPQVRAAHGGQEVTFARDLQDRPVLVAAAAIPSLEWSVLAEQPLSEAFEPVRASVLRTAILVLLGVGLSVVASLVLARRMVTPIRALEAGAARIGAGDLGHRIAVQTGDELEALAGEFNRMAARLQESYAGLERTVEERTRELREALEQQTATAEILRVISSSPTDIGPVLQAVADNTSRLCDARDVSIALVEGEVLKVVASHGTMARWWPEEGIPISRGSVTGRAVVERRPVHVHDLAAEPDEEFPLGKLYQQRGGHRTNLAIPLLREGAAVGAIAIRRGEVRPFSDAQIALVQTFADQAVIAIENVRLFAELQARTRELGRTVEELRALSEVSQAVSSSLDLRRVLDTVARHAVNLSGADACGIFEFDPGRGVLQVAGSHGLGGAYVEAVQTTVVDPRRGLIRRAIDSGEPVEIPDLTGEEEILFRRMTRQEGFRSLLAVPMGGGDITRGLVLFRRAPGSFDERVIRLLTTLSSQSHVAIQNARLFRELEAKTAQLEIANRHKSEFLANMSHELRTPLNAVIGFSEVLLERMFGELNDKQMEYLHDIHDSGRHLLSLINDILDLSKVEAGRMELEISQFSLPLAIDNAVTLVRTRAQNHGIALDVEVDRRLGPFAGDERKFKQILLNLLTNAVKFTPAGGRVAVRAMQVDGAVEVAVSDTGIGIAEEDQELIFEEFRQAGTDHAGRREGTGLGLTLTRKFVELHGGTIAVKSAPGRGSTFTVRLPERSWPAR